MKSTIRLANHPARLFVDLLLPLLALLIFTACEPSDSAATNEYLESLKEKAEAGDVKAQYTLGWKYKDGIGVSEDDGEAAKWFRMAAEQGHADAQFKLGEMYDYGRGVTENYVEAVKWYRKAAEQGDSRSQYNLGLMYHYGEGVRQDYDKAARWLWKAKQGDDKSPQVKKVMIALMYTAAGRVQQNEVEAYAWVLLLKENGDKKDSELISSFKEDLTAEQIKKGKSRAAELHRLIGLIE